jgi:hypothetical protein
MMGGHPIKLGLSRFFIDLMERKLITHIATYGAGIIHDFELAWAGGTSENVAKWIQTGQFGLWHETSRLNDIISEAASRNEGLGEAVGRVIEEEQFPNHDISITAAGYRLGIPVTSHVSIGSDILHAMPNYDGAALGQASYTDFLIFARAIQDLEGGVFLNIGSAVTGPEVYLKALSMARNVARRCASESGTGTDRPDPSQSQFPSRQKSESGTGTYRPDMSQSQFPSRQESESGTGTDRPDPSQSQFPRSDNGVRDKGTGTRGEPVPISLSPLPRHFTTAVFDLVDLPDNFRDGPPGKDHPLYYYRPWKTILCRTIADGGKSYYFQGDHRQTIPTLWHELVKKTESVTESVGDSR